LLVIPAQSQIKLNRVADFNVVLNIEAFNIGFRVSKKLEVTNAGAGAKQERIVICFRRGNRSGNRVSRETGRTQVTRKCVEQSRSPRARTNTRADAGDVSRRTNGKVVRDAESAGYIIIRAAFKMTA